jgi:hypothetical protein
VEALSAQLESQDLLIFAELAVFYHQTRLNFDPRSGMEKFVAVPFPFLASPIKPWQSRCWFVAIVPGEAVSKGRCDMHAVISRTRQRRRRAGIAQQRGNAGGTAVDTPFKLIGSL